MFGDNFKTEEAVRDIFQGEALVDGKLHYRKWVQLKFEED
jgi:hypothetical protein